MNFVRRVVTRNEYSPYGTTKVVRDLYEHNGKPEIKLISKELVYCGSIRAKILIDKHGYKYNEVPPLVQKAYREKDLTK